LQLFRACPKRDQASTLRLSPAPLLDQAANRELFEEGVDILFKAFEGKPFWHKGKYYTIPPEVPYRGYTLREITLVPAPERLPVECWQPIQSGSDRAFDFMAKHGFRGVIGGGSAEGGPTACTMTT
jgi:alkanesulfonate monooxygenase SsuD/methylene tetrahydromethanopterin reductase-like flavin-dependent oxidoreductase (luciferase family)